MATRFPYRWSLEEICNSFQNNSSFFRNHPWKRHMQDMDIGSRINFHDKFGRTILVTAVVRATTPICKALCEAGADINLRDAYYRKSPLEVAISSTILQKIDLLLRRGAHITHKAVCCAFETCRWDIIFRILRRCPFIELTPGCRSALDVSTFIDPSIRQRMEEMFAPDLWSPKVHCVLPSAIRATIRTIQICAATDPTCPLATLPDDVLQLVMALVPGNDILIARRLPVSHKRKRYASVIPSPPS